MTFSSWGLSVPSLFQVLDWIHSDIWWLVRFIFIVSRRVFVAMGEICYIIRRVCRRSKNVGGSGFGSHYYVDHRDVGVSHAMYWSTVSLLLMSRLANLGVCLKTKKRDLGKTAFSRILYLCRLQLGLWKWGYVSVCMIILLRKEGDSNTSRNERDRRLRQKLTDAEDSGDLYVDFFT